MRICLLTDSPELTGPRQPEDDWQCDPRPYLPEAEWDWQVLEKPTAVSRLIELARSDYDLFFNLCDGAWDEDRPGIEVVQTLERLGLPFTGADSRFYEPTREAMKRVCYARAIGTPDYVMVRRPEDIERAATTLRFPLIVKHPSSYASVGLTPESRVQTVEALRMHAAANLHTFGGALVEEFIDGREFTVLVAENPDDAQQPFTYTPVEFRFPEGESFKHERLKWVDYHDMGDVPVEEAELSVRLREMAASFFVGLDGVGYGRCDIRMDGNGELYMLEINPNCGLYYPPTDAGSADLCLLHDEAGHVGFTRAVVRAALQRHERRTQPWEVRTNGNGEHGVFAIREIRAGDPIIRFEERAHVLVTRSHVDSHWGEPDRSWFLRYAWPITDEVWVTWSRDPEDWMPVNHSCEPTAWIDGLDVVARTGIRPGQEVTLDYATFCNELMPSFNCECGAPNCRGTIRGDDYLRDFVTRYGDHLSDYVRRKRANGA